MARGRKKNNRNTRRMRYPNGYGTCYQLSNPERRQKPFVVKVPDGMITYTAKDGTIRTRYAFKVLDYVKTWEEGDALLREYNQCKLTVDNVVLSNRLTFSELYEVAWPRVSKDMGESALKSYSAAYKRLKDIYDIPIRDIKTVSMQSILDAMIKLGMGQKSIWNVKYICMVVFQYAYENDLVTKNYADFLDTGKATEAKVKKPFTKDEIELLFKNDDKQWIDVVLIYMYTGLRRNELLNMKREQVHLDERYMIGGSKTDAGRERIIPISRKIEKYIRKWYDKGNEYLITRSGKHIVGTNFEQTFTRVLNKLGLYDFTPHCCRITFASMLDDAGVNKITTQTILGHRGKDITEQIYIRKNLEQLLKAIDSI